MYLMNLWGNTWKGVCIQVLRVDIFRSLVGTSPHVEQRQDRCLTMTLVGNPTMVVGIALPDPE